VITNLEPDIKWALGSIATNKANGGNKILVEVVKILKTMLIKCCTQYASKFGKLSSGHRTGEGQFSVQSQIRSMPKKVQTTIELHSFHKIAR